MNYIDTTFSNMKKFFETDITKSVFFRQQRLADLAKGIKKYEADITQALYKDLNKAPQESYMTEIGLVLEEIRYAIRKLPSWERGKRKIMPLSQFPSTATVYSEPFGLVLIIAPWNYPFQLALSPLVGAIAAGNCCVIKPSEFAPHTSAVLAQLIAEVFEPKYVTVVEGAVAESQALLKQGFDYIFFTGSAKVGQLVMTEAAQTLTPVTLELGGKSPCIVHESADIPLAAKRIAFGKFLNAGQTCVAPDYVLVQETVKSDFLNYLVKYINKFLGPKPLLNKDYPKIITAAHYQRLLNLIAGEDVFCGGEGNAASCKIAPTILDNVTWDSPVMAEEIFGPILPVIAFKQPEEAIFTVKKQAKPLALYLFARDNVLERDVLRSLSFGGGCINDTVIHLSTPKLPFGGVGHSGIGSYHGKYSFDTFSHKKSVVNKKSVPDLNFRYHPYSPTKLNWIKRFLH